MSRARLGALGAALAVMAVLTPALPLAGASSPPDLASVVIPNLGYGYTVTAQGPLQASALASSSSDPGGVAHAVHTLGRTVTTYQRVWQDAARHNEVQDLVLRFSSAGAASTFLATTRRSLAAAEIVGSASLPQVPGATRTTYFATTDQVGVGQAITLRDGNYVVVLSIFSASTGNAQPISETDAITMARAQRVAVARAVAAQGDGDGAGPIFGWSIVAVLVAVFGAAIALLAWRRRRMRTTPAWQSGPDAP